MDTLSDRMELDSKLKVKKKLPGPAAYQNMEKLDGAKEAYQKKLHG